MNSKVFYKNFNMPDHAVTFLNSQDDIILSGTLSIPRSPKKPAVVILVAGVGPYDRDCTQMNGHKMFLTLANYFTKQGIAVLRYDKRGTGKSAGSFENASLFDFTQDVFAAVEFLKQRSDINTNAIGLVGHSEGGLISFIVASQSKNISFVVSLAGGVVTHIKDLLLQAQLLFKAGGASDEFVAFDRTIRKQILEIVTTMPAQEAHEKLLPLVKSFVESMTEGQKGVADTLLPFALTEQNYEQWVVIFNTIWRPILLSNPVDIISKITIPFLAVNGELDFIIPCAPALSVIAQGAEKAGNQDATIKALPNRNHCFQKCNTGALSEYIENSEGFDTSTLQLITDWIVAKV